jgi:hypothetical protein
MKKFIFLFLFIGLSQRVFSQIPKKVVVEHFTNTKCSICSSRNPGFYSNYNAQSGVIHLAIHPSSPYSGCVLSQHNVLENDARTNYYGVYGSTPRLVIQGVVIPAGADYSSSSIFASYLGQLSPASIKIVQSKYESDSIRCRIVIRTEASHALPVLSLFVALVEDTINYTGSNGEPVHYDVFRRSLTGAAGVNVTLPSAVGDSVVYSMASTANGSWNFSKIYTLAILQERASKAVVQSENISTSYNNISTGISDEHFSNTNISTVATVDGIIVKQDKFIENTCVTIYDLMGRILFTKTLTTNLEILSPENISPGIYLYTVNSKGSIVKTGKFFIQ